MKTFLSAIVIAASAFSTSAATLSLPSSVWAVSLNGKPVSQFASQLSLTDGPQVVELKYGELLQLNAEDHEMITSAPLYLSFEGDGSERYQLLLPILEDEQAVRQFARQPKVTLRSDAGPVENRLLTQSQLLVLMARHTLDR
ncbi:MULTISPECIES: DUF2057 family protein [Ferrimonas]|uniref:DUF2057 family protein n=1 Tax=Ferrimonas TaxID=44011 RepID=UPI0003FB3208|nr:MULTISPECIES: DUF2057 family protein [Ferrimonas]USD37766.1 DUF2057 family protein [Ferrimonas sp. SCSIO 43195]